MVENRLFGKWEKALLLSLQVDKTSEETVQSLEELASLVFSLGGKVVDRIIQNRRQVNPGYYFGKGKLSEIKETLHQSQADAVVVDASLSPIQTRNLEKKMKRLVLDRTQVILDIFAHNARTREAKLQIELAQSEYLLPRLVGLWQHLDRERGGIGVTRGGGEKQIEKDRQYLRKRISRLKEELKRLQRERDTQKKRRTHCLNVSLVGYTNAGKSTIMNAMTDSHLLVEDKLFATLDSTTRLLEEDSRPKILLSDTVGFIKHLPHELIAAFRSTLGTILDADLLLHVIDTGVDFEDHIQTTSEVLEQMGADCIPLIEVFNKVDRISRAQLQILKKLNPDAVFVSALNGGVEALKQKIVEFFDKRMETVTICLDYENSRNLSDIYDWSRVDNIDYREEGIMMTLTTLPGNLNRIRHRLAPELEEVTT